ncbi:MAG: DnaB-like helicase C-terminal domain-containing protein [Candidatus Limnocylindrales bacterium]
MTVPEAPNPGSAPPSTQNEPGGDAPAAAPPRPPTPQPPLAPLPAAPPPATVAPPAPGKPLPTSQAIGLDPALSQTPLAPTQPSAITPTDETLGGKTWEFDSGIGSIEPRSATQVLSSLASKVAEGDVTQYQPVPLGFTPLDKSIGGGIRAGEMLLIGGAQGTGKTTMAVQMARNIVMSGLASVLYICFEHDEEYLLNRIIAQESVLPSLPSRSGGVKLTEVRNEILGTWMATGGQNADLGANPRLRPALERINRYGPNLYLLRGSQTTSTVENMAALVEKYKELAGDQRLVVFIDYLQKVPVHPEPPNETEKVTSVVQGLKDLALNYEVPLISIVAADKEGLKASRLRNHHLRGSSAINYEADIILILNEKYQIVAKVNIEFNPYQAQRFRDWVVATIEKNRGGTNAVDLEYQKYFEYSCFDPNGRTVMEKLIEERLYND